MENANESANGDVDKSLFDAEQFLSNYTNLREECDRLKTENHDLQMRMQQLSQDLNQAQLDKQNLDRHIQKEALKNKEVIWNLKLEIQKSQEERLSWKEKYLDLCIKSSQNLKKNLASGKRTDSSPDSSKRVTKKERKKSPRKKRKSQLESQSTKSLESEVKNCDDSQKEQASIKTNEPSAGIGEVEHEDSLDDTPLPQEEPEPATLASSLTEEDTTMSTADVVALDANLNSSVSIAQNQDVTTGNTEYYGLQTGPFDLNNQGESSSTTATFILQTNDATFCAAAVLDEQQRSAFENSPFGLKASNGTFDGSTATFEQLGESGSDSEENIEFNFRCNLCNFTYSDQIGLEKHLKAKHSMKNVFCKECGKAYSTKSSLAQHVHHYHRHPMAYSCEVCQKKFNRKDFLIKHQKTHTDDRTFQCGHCDKQFKTSASLSAHVNGAHNDARRFVCDFCGMRTSWRLSHLEHMKLHTGEPRKTSSKKKREQQEQQMRDQQVQMQHQQLQQHLQQQLQPQEMQQIVVEPGTGAVVQFITTADG